MLLARIPEKGWQCLANGLSQIDNAEQSGLYHIEIRR